MTQGNVRIKKKTEPFFYGWLIVMAATLLTAVGLGLFFSTNSVFVKPVCEELGLTRAQYSMHRSIVTLCGALMMPFYGKLIKRIGSRNVLLMGGIGLSISMICYSVSTKLWGIYIAALINGIFLNGLSFMSIGVLINLWFTEKRGFATGIAYCGSGLGAAIAVPLVGAAIEAFGWRDAYRLMALAGILISVPTILLIVRDTPAKKGLLPFTRNATESAAKNDKVITGVTLAQVKKRPEFWLLLLALFGFSGCVAGPNTHTVPYLTDIGYSTHFATTVVSVFMLTLSSGKILLGWIYDRFGTLAGNIFISVSCIGFPILALAARVQSAAWGFAVFIGLASASSSVPLSVLIVKYFGDLDFTAIFSVSNIAATLGAATIVPVMGWIYDSTGSYTGGWAVLLVIALISTVSLLAVHRRYSAK